MAIRNILKASEHNEFLRKKSKIVNDVKSIYDLLDDLWETLHHANGAGLAAPQVGILKRVAVVEIDGLKLELINPVIIEKSDEQVIQTEGCLSFPNQWGKVARPKMVIVETLDRQGNTKTITATDWQARAICHEVEHLDGILYVDNVLEEE